MMIDNRFQSQIFTGILWKFLERSFAQIVSLSVSIILARILDPENYVPISIITIFFNFANTIISGGLSTALIQKKDADKEDYSSVLGISLILAAAVYIVLFLCAPFIASFCNRIELIVMIRVMGTILFVNAAKSVICAYISRGLQFKHFFLSTSIGTIVSAFLGIFLAWNGAGSWALVVQQMTNSIIDTFVLYLTTDLKLSLKVNFLKVKNLFKFGTGIFLTSFIGAFYDDVSPLIIGIKFSATDLTFYEKGKSFPSLLNSAFNDTITTVLFPALSKVQEDKEIVLRFIRRFVRLSSFFIFPVMVGFFCISDSFVEVILTEKWCFVSPYIKIFCICYSANFIQTGSIQVIKSIGRSDILLKLEIFKKLSYMIVLVFFIYVSNSPLSIAFASVINTVIATIINTYPNRKLIGYSYKYQIQDIRLNFTAAIIMGVCVSLIGFIGISSKILLPIQIISGILIYLYLNLIIKNDNLYYILSLLKSLRKREKE